ncbi:MAG: LamG-like jellyroll fold domain-containing protein, partial [bacterium]
CQHQNGPGENGPVCDQNFTGEEIGWMVFERSQVNPQDGIEARNLVSCQIKYHNGSSWTIVDDESNCYETQKRSVRWGIPADNSENAEIKLTVDAPSISDEDSNRFTVDSTKPDDFGPVTPEDGGCVSSPTDVTLDWQSSSDPSPGSGLSHYMLWVDRPDSFATYWPLEAQNQRNIISGLGYDGIFKSPENLPDWNNGHRSNIGDNAVEFQGAPEYIKTDWKVNGDALADEGTVSMWAYFENDSNRQWSGVFDDNGRFYTGHCGNSTDCDSDDAIFGYGDTFILSGNLSTFSWELLTVTFDGSNVIAYQNGEKLITQSGSFNADIDSNVYLGARNYQGEDYVHFQDGARISEVQIYRGSLTQRQVKRIASDTLPVWTEDYKDEYTLWDLTDGDSYTWQVQAVDNAGNINGFSPKTFTVDSSNPEQSDVIDPDDGDYIGGNVDYVAHAKDSPCGLDRVEFYAHYEGDDAPRKLGVDRSDSPFRLAWDASSETEGTWDLYVEAYDKGGNMLKSDSITVEMDNTDPAITVTSPSQGDKIEANTTETITWDATDSGGSGYDSFVIDYREEPTGTWSEINDVEGDKRSYDWSVPETWADSAAIRVTAKDTAGNTNSDTSGDFLIFRELYVEMLRPDGGEYWKGGDTETLRWDAPARDLEGIEKYDDFVLEYQRDEPYAWSEITTITDTQQTEYVWDPLPTYDTGEVRVRIIANGQSGGNYADTSGQFWIDSTDPVPSWTTPDTGDFVDDKVDLESGSSDNESGLELVRFWHGSVGDTQIQEVGGKSPHKATWDEERSPEGWHDLTLEA